MSPARMLALVVLVLAPFACALFSKGEVPARRTFTPDSLFAPAASVVARSPLELRLGRVTAGTFLSERMMYRESAFEVGFYEDRVWTQKPELYLRRGLTRVLFEEQGLRSVLRGAGPTLDVELLAFEEVLAPVHVGRVKLAFTLSDERLVSLQETLTVERPVEATPDGDEASAVAQTMGEALREAISQLARRVAAALAKGAAAPAPSPLDAAGAPASP